MTIDLNRLLENPDFSTISMLTIEALAPLSMVASMPGKYYRSQPSPTNAMLYGLLENALWWHVSDRERTALLKVIQKKLGKASETSGVGFASLLQFHVRFGLSLMPTVMHYDDYWSQHLKGSSFVGGSREYDKQVIPIMDAVAGKRVTIDDRAESNKNAALIQNFKSGDKVHVNVIRPYFPQYYVSPTPREYIMPLTPYTYRVDTSAQLAALIADAIADPAAPLYLGSNDGWVEADWRTLS